VPERIQQIQKHDIICNWFVMQGFDVQWRFRRPELIAGFNSRDNIGRMEISKIQRELHFDRRAVRRDSRVAR